MKANTRGKKGEMQKEILHYIYEMVEDRGYPPTVREIAQAMRLASTSTVHGHLKKLEQKGYIYKDAAKPRAIEVTTRGLEFLGVKAASDKIPILGSVTAGMPILAVQEVDDYFPLPDHLSHIKEDLFMLTIHGDSMIEAGILDGDAVIVQKQPTANNGDIVIVLTEDDEATCKRFYKENNHFRLQPENELYEPIILDHVQILGKVVSLYREHIF